MKKFSQITVCALAAALSACGGGGGSGGNGAPSVVRPTSSFSQVPKNGSIDTEGTAIALAAPKDLNGRRFRVDGMTSEHTSSKWTYDESGKLQALTIDAPDRKRSDSWVNSGASNQISCGNTGCIATSPAAAIATFQPTPDNFDYLSMGFWLTDSYGSADVAVKTYFATGIKTSPEGIPTSGSATYNGLAIGGYNTPDRESLTTAALTAVANFSDRSITLATTGTTLDGVAASHLDLNGILTYSSGSNQFSGAVKNSQLSGSAVGHFFGPTAQEIGGTYVLTGRGFDSPQMAGTFAGKR